MVTITVYKDKASRRIKLTAEGHARAGDPGRDPVCAGISAMMIGYAKTVMVAAQTGLVNEEQTRVNVGGRPGQGHIETVCLTEEAYNRLVYAMMPAELFFQGLQESKPNHVRILCRPCGG